MLFQYLQINICVLQASIVEEVIPFSSLENVNDLMAVSLLSLCLDSIRCQLLANKHSCTLTPVATGKEGLGARLSNTPVPAPAPGVVKRGKTFGSQLDKVMAKAGQDSSQLEKVCKCFVCFLK